MRQKERTRLHVAHCLIEGKMRISEAALVLGLCERQVIRLKKGALEQGVYFEVIRQVVARHGIPLSIYADRHTIFLSPKNDKLSLEEQLAGKTVNDSQFGRALKELGIQLIAARSPQAKSRIERFWETLQSRLPMEFKLANINSLDATNAFLQTFINIYNHKFAVSPENSELAYRQLPDSLNLDFIPCLKKTRIVDNGSVFSLDKQYYQIVKTARQCPLYQNPR